MSSVIHGTHRDRPGQAALPTSVAGILAALSAVILGAFMSILDATIVNVALPTFGRVFESSLNRSNGSSPGTCWPRPP